MNAQQSKLRVIVHDDQDIFREGLLQIIRSAPDLQLMADAKPGDNIASLVEIKKPHVFITSVNGSPVDGISATKLIAENYPEVNVLAISSFWKDHDLLAILGAGAKGCIIRNAPREELIEAIKAVAQNIEYYSAQVGGKLFSMLADKTFPKNISPDPRLMDKDWVFLKFLCQELTMKQISDKMNVTVRSLEHRKNRLCAVLQKQTIAGLVNYSIRTGIFNPYEFEKRKNQAL